MQFYTKVLIGMAVGVVMGFFFGPNSSFLPASGAIVSPDAQVVSTQGGTDVVAQASGIDRMTILEESSGDPPWLKVSWTLTGKDVVRLASSGIQAVAGEEHQGWVLSDPVKARRFAPLVGLLRTQSADPRAVAHCCRPPALDRCSLCASCHRQPAPRRHLGSRPPRR